MKRLWRWLTRPPWQPPVDPRAADLSAPALWTPMQAGRYLREGETVWLVFWGVRLERCEAFTTRSLAIAFSRDFPGAIVEHRIVHGEQLWPS